MASKLDDSSPIDSGFHYPGSNYCGPGTNVYKKVMNGVRPSDYHDRLALLHDIEYLVNNSKDVRLVDIKTAFNAFKKPNVKGVIMGTTLLFKALVETFINLNINKPIKGLTKNQTKQLGHELEEFINMPENREYYQSAIKYKGNIRDKPRFPATNVDYSYVQKQQPQVIKNENHPKLSLDIPHSKPVIKEDKPTHKQPTQIPKKISKIIEKKKKKKKKKEK